MVYCTRRKLFTSITSFRINFRKLFDLQSVLYGPHPERHDWDLGDPNSPQIVGSELLFSECYSDERGWFYENIEVLEDECVQIPHLVYAEESDQIFVVMQFVRLMSGDGRSPLGCVPSCEFKGLRGVFPGKTFGFMVMEMVEKDLKQGMKRDLNDERVCTAVGDLNGMSMIIGINHSFAVPAASHGEFKPNCIYFTDAKRLRMVCCQHDTGVFDYATKTISPLDHHLPTQASPFWFT